MTTSRIKRVEIEVDEETGELLDATFYFVGSDEPFSVTEFVDCPKKDALYSFIESVQDNIFFYHYKMKAHKF